MRKARNSKLALLLVLTMLATLFVGIPTASAAATYSAVSVVRVQAGAQQDLGSVKIAIPAAEVRSGDWISLRLPSDFDFVCTGTTDNNFVPQGVTAATYYADDVTQNVYFRFPSVKNAITCGGNFPSAALQLDKLANNELKLTVRDATYFQADPAQDTAYFYVDLKNVKVAAGFSGDVTLAIDGSAGSPFVSGSVVIATVGTGKTTLSIDSVKTITTSIYSIDNIRIKEDRAGAFATGNSIKLKLPNGFKWRGTVADYTYNRVDGNGTYAFALEDDSRTLVITSQSNSNVPTYAIISAAGIDVADETVAKLGDVVVTVSGTATASPESFVVAKYGEYKATAYAVGEPTTVMAGRHSRGADTYIEIGKFAIEEAIKGSLVNQRTITLQLTGVDAKWVANGGNIAGITKDESECKGDYTNISNSWQITGSAGDTAKVTVNGQSNNAIKAVFKKAQITVAADQVGDVKLVVGGTAGVSGEFVVAKVIAPVTASIEGSVPDVIIGKGAQEIPDIVVTENAKEAILAANNYNTLRLEFPNGVLPTKPTKVEVIEGDMTLDVSKITTSMSTDNLRWGIDVTVKSTSAKPAKIKFSGIKITTDRTVPEGALQVKVKGSSIVQNGTEFPGRSAAAVTVANCVTPAPEETKANTVLVAGSTTMKVNGADVTMDVAPYLKDSRLFVSVRYAAQALGVADNNILWDNATKTATLMTASGRVIQMTVGSKVMVVNGAKINMDVAPEMLSNRVMLPVGWLAQALGAKATWDGTTSTATLEL